MHLLAAGLITALLAPSTVAEQATTLANLRAEIGLAEAELRAERTRGLTEVQGLAQRKARLEAEVAAERRRVQAIRDDQARAEAQVAARGAAASDLRAAVLEGVEALSRPLQTGLPYRVAERQAALADLRVSVLAGRLDPAEGAAQLWRFAEDELRLTAEVARLSLPVDLGDGPRLVEVVKLGMVALLVREPSQEGFGRLIRSDGTWAYTPIKDAVALEAVAHLFLDLDRDIQGGLYTLPLPPPEAP